MAFPGAPVPVNEIPKDKSFPLPNSIDQEVSPEGVQVFSVLPVDPRRLCGFPVLPSAAPDGPVSCAVSSPWLLDFPATGTMMEFDVRKPQDFLLPQPLLTTTTQGTWRSAI
ncbi:uncharacterized protein LOC123384594 isoform X2 [Felis catus]|uniref:uncharacterized protein LOC123384594 isoform X2 n=1 Tax=Felis catus TaxID=9685 RepID=UPI001D1A2298|nr:uncharacterized protein LOC123384594 isoform X2 [Felis catus]